MTGTGTSTKKDAETLNFYYKNGSADAILEIWLAFVMCNLACTRSPFSNLSFAEDNKQKH